LSSLGNFGCPRGGIHHHTHRAHLDRIVHSPHRVLDILVLRIPSDAQLPINNLVLQRATVLKLDSLAARTSYEHEHRRRTQLNLSARVFADLAGATSEAELLHHHSITPPSLHHSTITPSLHHHSITPPLPQHRLVSTGVYLFFMGLTLFLAFYKESIPARVLWLVISIICQFFALAWYTLSFIPFARDIVKGFLRDWCCKDCCSTAPADEDLWFT
jgi:hypothetical protein